MLGAAYIKLPNVGVIFEERASFCCGILPQRGGSGGRKVRWLNQVQGSLR